MLTAILIILAILTLLGSEEAGEACLVVLLIKLAPLILGVVLLLLYVFLGG